MSSNRRCSANSSGGGYGKAPGLRSYAAARARRVGRAGGPGRRESGSTTRGRARRQPDRHHRLTEDHSAAVEFASSGAIVSTRVATRNALTRSLGTATASVESTRFEVWSGDRVLLCSGRGGPCRMRRGSILPPSGRLPPGPLSAHPLRYRHHFCELLGHFSPRGEFPRKGHHFRTSRLVLDPFPVLVRDVLLELLEHDRRQDAAPLGLLARSQLYSCGPEVDL